MLQHLCVFLYKVICLFYYHDINYLAYRTRERITHIDQNVSRTMHDTKKAIEQQKETEIKTKKQAKPSVDTSS